MMLGILVGGERLSHEFLDLYLPMTIYLLSF